MNKIIIGLVGETGSGKDTVANYLAEKYGAKKIRFGDVLDEALRIFVDDIAKQDQQWLALQLRERFGADILGRALRKKIEAAEGLIVINGIRMPEDFDFVKSFDPSFVIYITASQKLRWERVVGRGEKTDDAVDFSKFQEIEGAGTEVHIPEIGAKTDFTIRNEKDLDFLLQSADEVMGKIIQ